MSGSEHQSPLGWLKSRKDRNGRPLIDAAQFEAGMRLGADYALAQHGPRIIADWSRLAPRERVRCGASAGAADVQNAVLDARARVARALSAVGPEVSGVLIDICCEFKGLEEAEKTNGWPQRAGKVVLQIALTRLAKHYGLVADTCPPRRRVRHRGEANPPPKANDVPPGPPAAGA